MTYVRSDEIVLSCRTLHGRAVEAVDHALHHPPLLRHLPKHIATIRPYGSHQRQDHALPDNGPPDHDTASVQAQASETERERSNHTDINESHTHRLCTGKSCPKFPMHRSAPAFPSIVSPLQTLCSNSKS